MKVLNLLRDFAEELQEYSEMNKKREKSHPPDYYDGWFTGRSQAYGNASRWLKNILDIEKDYYND
ncbi:MAG: hypothetical protein ACOC80_07500 [Petrotogales bacterium]